MWALVVLLLAQTPITPPQKVPQARLHIYVHELLNAELLRSLARPEAILWIDAGGQVLRESTVDTLARASDAWLKVSLPVSEVLARQMQRAMNAGIWLSQEPSDAASLYRLGPRRISFSLVGDISDGAFAWGKKPPTVFLDWKPQAEMSLLDFGWLSQWPGQKVVSWPQAPAHFPSCARWRSHQVSWRIEASYLRRHTGLQPPCGTSLRILLDGVPTDEFLKRWISNDPGVTWEFFVGADEARARRAMDILKRFEGISP